MEKQTPKQRVLAVYPKAVAVKLDAKTVMSAPTWAVLEENDEHARTLGENGSANGAWKNAADRLNDPMNQAIEHDRQVMLDNPAIFGPNDYIENADPKVGDVFTFRGKDYPVSGMNDGDEGGALSISQSQEARERATARVNGFSKLMSDSTRQPMHKTSRQLERKATRDAHGYDLNWRTGTITRK